ncbi:MAG: phosphate/phosphite/phosphonate ABC transporter substrate-binding protein, partial [Zoogloea sp.]|nr:phosphate/phosphite/phosphonate ABC transporter substrate-binding protein [Zoogloea sp.]
MYRRHFLASLAALPVLLCSRPLSAQTQPLRLGIMPFNTPLSLMRAHQALRDSLATQLRRNVEIGTSADYITFLNDSLDARFDLLITGPHFGVMSMEKGYEPLFHYRAKLVPVFVVRTESNLHDPQKLRGKLIALSSRLSISSVGGLRWLEQHGLKVGRDIGVIEKPTHGAAIAA